MARESCLAQHCSFFGGNIHITYFQAYMCLVCESKEKKNLPCPFFLTSFASFKSNNCMLQMHALWYHSGLKGREKRGESLRLFPHVHIIVWSSRIPAQWRQKVLMPTSSSNYQVKVNNFHRAIHVGSILFHVDAQRRRLLTKIWWLQSFDWFRNILMYFPFSCVSPKT